MSVGIVLVHGYSGSQKDLLPLVDRLVADYGTDAVRLIALPGHDRGKAPPFDPAGFVASISRAVADLRAQDRQIVLVGHSTGGILILSFLRESSFEPELLVLASVPKKIDAGYMKRWDTHTAEMDAISFSSVAGMVSLINAVGCREIAGSFPVFLLHGEHDTLVPYQESLAWRDSRGGGPTRSAIIPRAGHDLFRGQNSAMAIDAVRRAIADTVLYRQADDRETAALLMDVEKEIGDFLSYSPLSTAHISRCASGQRVAGRTPSLSHIAQNDPVFANIEITTRCNMACTCCARALWGRRGERDMSLDTFQRVLESLPHAYRVTLVGLGEPLLHPQIAEFVALALSMRRRVGIVTNAMCLDRSIARELLDAGLASIAFSIDGADQAISSEVRPGTDFARVIQNVRAFVDLEAQGRPISKAVFSAVSVSTVRHLKQLVDVVAGLGVDVLMLTDLNYRQNQKDTLWKNVDDDLARTVREAVGYAFSKRLPVLSVRGLEAFGLARLYEDFVLIPPSQIYGRSERRTYCFSPWQTVPVDVEGHITVCDCQPDQGVGNLLSEPFSDIWNGRKMAEFRRTMLSDDPPEACRVCPRF